jgi:hypothetical protein
MLPLLINFKLHMLYKIFFKYNVLHRLNLLVTPQRKSKIKFPFPFVTNVSPFLSMPDKPSHFYNRGQKLKKA